MTGAGVIAGIVSYIVLAVITKALDFASDKTGGMFGYTTLDHVDGPEARETTFRIKGREGLDQPSAGSGSEDSQAAKVRAFQLWDHAHCILNFLRSVCMT